PVPRINDCRRFDWLEQHGQVLINAALDTHKPLLVIRLLEIREVLHVDTVEEGNVLLGTPKVRQAKLKLQANVFEDGGQVAKHLLLGLVLAKHAWEL